MQVSTYISAKDYETLGNNKPAEKTVPQFMADILREKAELFRNNRGVF